MVGAPGRPDLPDLPCPEHCPLPGQVLVIGRPAPACHSPTAQVQQSALEASGEECQQSWQYTGPALHTVTTSLQVTTNSLTLLVDSITICDLQCSSPGTWRPPGTPGPGWSHNSRRERGRTYCLCCGRKVGLLCSAQCAPPPPQAGPWWRTVTPSTRNSSSRTSIRPGAS